MVWKAGSCRTTQPWRTAAIDLVTTPRLRGLSLRPLTATRKSSEHPLPGYGGSASSGALSPGSLLPLRLLRTITEITDKPAYRVPKAGTQSHSSVLFCAGPWVLDAQLRGGYHLSSRSCLPQPACVQLRASLSTTLVWCVCC